MDLASVVAALASVGVRVSGSTPNNNIQGDSSRACPTGLAGPEPSGTHNDPGQHFHTRAHSMWVADPNSPPTGRAVGGEGAPDLRRPSQRWKAPPPGAPFRHPHSEQRRPARAHAVGPVLGPHACTDRTRDTRVAEPRLPAPEDRRPGEGERLTPDAPQNGGRPPHPGMAPHQPRGRQPPQGMQAKGTVLGPHTGTPAPTACGWRTPTARPVGGQFIEGERLTSDAPHNGGRHPPGTALPPPPQRATPACKGALKVLPWVVVGAGGLGAGKTSGAGTRGVSLDVVIGGRTGHSDTNGGESSDNRSKVHADCGPAENPSL